MRIYKIHHIDSFTNKLFGGNPTVTVLNADSLSEEEMRKIANEMNLSETGFILSSNKANFRLKFFTPSGNEIKFCGHATVGALCSVAKDGLFGCTEGRNHLTIETNAGILNVEIDIAPGKEPQFIFDSPKIELVSAPYTLEEVIQALGISKELIDDSKRLMLEKTNNYLYLAARDLNSLGKVNLDIQKAINFAKKDQIVVFCILTNKTFDPSYEIHARGFAPLVGIPEDPFTGSMQGGLAAYAIAQGMIQTNKKWIGVEQGHFIDRPGFVKLEISKAGSMHVRLHSEAVHVFASELMLP